jgi:hypothetical protein
MRLRLAAPLEAMGDGRWRIDQLYGDRHEEGRTLQKLALVLGHDDPALGAALAERALALIDPVREARCELAARHTLVWFLNDRGLGWEALDLLERTRPLYLLCGESQRGASRSAPGASPPRTHPSICWPSGRERDAPRERPARHPACPASKGVLPACRRVVLRAVIR